MVVVEVVVEVVVVAGCRKLLLEACRSLSNRDSGKEVVIVVMEVVLVYGVSSGSISTDRNWSGCSSIDIGSICSNNIVINFNTLLGNVFGS